MHDVVITQNALDDTTPSEYLEELVRQYDRIEKDEDRAVLIVPPRAYHAILQSFTSPRHVFNHDHSEAPTGYRVLPVRTESAPQLK